MPWFYPVTCGLLKEARSESSMCHLLEWQQCTISFHLQAMPALSVYKMNGKAILIASFSAAKWKRLQQNKQSDPFFSRQLSSYIKGWKINDHYECCLPAPGRERDSFLRVCLDSQHCLFTWAGCTVELQLRMSADTIWDDKAQIKCLANTKMLKQSGMWCWGSRILTT